MLLFVEVIELKGQRDSAVANPVWHKQMKIAYFVDIRGKLF